MRLLTPAARRQHRTLSLQREAAKGGPPPPHLSRTALFTIRPFAAADPIQVETLLDKTFGTDRHGRTAYRLRAGAAPVADLSFAAFDEDEALAGTLQSWPVQLRSEHGPATPLILLGPVAVEPARQGCGLGKALMQQMLSAWTGHVPLVLIGDPDYYSRFFG